MARFDLTNMAQGRGNRQAVISLAPNDLTAALIRQLQRINRRVMDPWLESKDRINEIYRTELERRLMQDRTDPFSNLFAQLTIVLDALIASLEVDMEAYAAEVESWQRNKWERAILMGTGITIGTLIGPADARDTIGDFIARNVALVQNVSDSTKQRISDLVFRSLQDRTPSRQVARQISEQMNIERRRAQRIADDQANKLAAALDRQRHQEAGIEFWKWRHSGKQHFRPEHLARDGLIYHAGSAPEDLPGQLPFCGCLRQAVLILDDDEAARIRGSKVGVRQS